MSLKPTAFTVKFKGIARVITTQVDIHGTSLSKSINVKAIWDTGATGSVITKNVSSALGLIPTGKSQVHTANGHAIQNTYTIDIRLPNRVLIQGIPVTEVDALSGGCDALIGMDVISLGDFSITNYKGFTCFSFRIPSSHEIDYVKNLNMGVQPHTPHVTSKSVTPDPTAANNYAGTPLNDKCPCGSTKQYKRCHGKKK